MGALKRGSSPEAVPFSISLSTRSITCLGLALAPVLSSGLAISLVSDTGAVRTHDADTLVIGLPNSLVTIGLVRLNSGAGLVGVLTEILGIPGGVTTDSTAR